MDKRLDSPDKRYAKFNFYTVLGASICGLVEG